MRSFFKKFSLFQAFLRQVKSGGTTTQSNTVGVGNIAGKGSSWQGKRILRGAMVGAVLGMGVGAFVEVARGEVWEWTWKGVDEEK